MSKAVAFLKKASEDSALKEVVKAAIEKAATKDEEVQAVAEIAKNAGFDVSANELKAVVVNVLQQTGQLSDKDLENVAGGGAIPNVDSHTGEEQGEFIDNTATDAYNAVASMVSGW